LKERLARRTVALLAPAALAGCGSGTALRGDAGEAPSVAQNDGGDAPAGATRRRRRGDHLAGGRP
jgi:hypothetical protein